MKTIVVPTDLTPITDRALSVAVGLARTYQAEISLLHSVVYPLSELVYAETLTMAAGRSTVATYEHLEQDALSTLQRFAHNPAYVGVTITPVMITNGQPPAQEIAKHPADLIVMTSEGASGWDEWLIGSNAEVVVRYACCPVLVIKDPVEPFKPENIVCAVDVDDRLKDIHHHPFQMGERGLHQFLYVITPTDDRDPEGVRDWVNGFAQARGIAKFDFIMRPAKSVPEGIIRYAKDVQADLIVLYTNGNKGLLHFLMGSVAEDVLNHARMPVLIMRV